MRSSENLDQVPVTIKYGSNRKSTNLDFPQMQNQKKKKIVITTEIKKIEKAKTKARITKPYNKNFENS